MRGQLEFDTFVDWHEHNTLVKTVFPLALHTAESRAEIQFGHVTRATHANTSWDQARYEYPMQRWIDLGEPGFGVAFLNDCKYGYDAKGTTVRLTLLRSPTWPWAEADQGEHRFRYAMMLHDGADMAAVSAAAERFNHPMTLVAGTGDGAGVDLSGLASPDNAAIAVEAVKRAEDGDGLIVRLWERSGGRQQTTVRFAAEIAAVAETDLTENETAALGMDGQAVRLDFAPFEIKTLRLTPAAHGLPPDRVTKDTEMAKTRLVSVKSPNGQGWPYRPSRMCSTAPRRFPTRCARVFSKPPANSAIWRGARQRRRSARSIAS